MTYRILTRKDLVLEKLKSKDIDLTCFKNRSITYKEILSCNLILFLDENKEIILKSRF